MFSFGMFHYTYYHLQGVKNIVPCVKVMDLIHVSNLFDVS